MPNWALLARASINVAAAEWTSWYRRLRADAQASLQEQFDRHKCEPEDSSEAPARVNADVLLRDEPEDEEEEEEDDRKEEDDDDEGDGYSE
jgi:hypothetical protein